MYLRVGAMGEYHVKFFETDNNDFRLLRYTHPLPYLTSIFRVALKVYVTSHYMWQVRFHLIVSCAFRGFPKIHCFQNFDKILSNSTI